jgi:hypothetical protein
LREYGKEALGEERKLHETEMLRLQATIDAQNILLGDYRNLGSAKRRRSRKAEAALAIHADVRGPQ